MSCTDEENGGDHIASNASSNQNQPEENASKTNSLANVPKTPVSLLQVR